MDIYDVWFSRVEISNSKKIELLSYYEPKKIWTMDRKMLDYIGLDDITASKILDIKYRDNLEEYFKYLKNHRIHLMTLKDYYYPQKLMDIPDFPAYLFIKGNKKILEEDSVAIIGSRYCTGQGKQLSYNTAKELGDKNINVVSGLANGIDTYAHLGSLSSSFGKTIAVLANGLASQDLYPPENLKLAKEIVKQGGALVSEYIIGTKAKKEYFPIRNRIVSGLANKILVVEAGEKSGTLITVRSWIRSRKGYICCASED